MAIKYTINDTVTPEEMQSLEESVGLGRHRSLERNRISLAGSLCGAERLVSVVKADELAKKQFR